jgi:predicted P-loop ATPase
MEKQYDELRDWLRSLEWDKQPRVENWLHSYLGADDNPYTKEAGTIWLKGAVARVLNPGIQFDLAMILEGDQGVGKTSALRILAGSYHIETALELDRKGEDEIIRKLHGSESWIIEMSELTAFRKSEIESLKSFLTKTHDHYRKPYAREVTIKARGFVFAGTTNDTTYLADSANRRYLPVKVRHLEREQMENDRQQLLAEAVAMYKANPRLTLAPEVWKFVEEERESRRIVNVDEDTVRGFLANRSVVRVSELAELIYGQNFTSKAGVAFSRRMGVYLKTEGFEQCYGATQQSGQRHVRMWRREYHTSKSESELWKIYEEEREDMVVGGDSPAMTLV